MGWWLALAIATQTLDGMQTCQVLKQGGRELNPLLPNTCSGVVVTKAALIGVTPLLPEKFRKGWLVGISVGGGVGFTVTYVINR